MNHDVGNLLNTIVFGRTYEREEPVWLELQRTREAGIRKLNVNNVLNFLPATLTGWLQAGTEREIARGQRIAFDEYLKCTKSAKRRLEERVSIVQIYCN